ncbi:hypothetical protein TeGR_g13522, partial [Tetraparma gracilis]
MADRGVPVTIGPTHSGASMGFGTISRQTNMPFLSPSASSPKLNSRDAETGFPLFSRNFPSDDFQGVALADLAQHYGWTTCATISQSADEYSEGLTTTFSSVADSRGIGISSQLSMGTGDSDEDIATKLTQAKNSGTRIDATDPAFVEGILGLEPYLNTDSDGWQQMKTNWLSLGATPGETYADLAVSPAYGEFDDENPWPGYNYDAVWIVAKALDALITAEGVAAVQDPDKMTASIRATTLPDGATGSIQFTSEGNMI